MYMKAYIYKIQNILNKKCYIGKSINVLNRWNEHKQNVKKHRQHPLYDSIRCYGIENFMFDIICECDFKDVDMMEKYYIKLYDSINSGYNLTAGGTGGDTFTNRSEKSKSEYRKYQSNKMKDSPYGFGNISMKGKHITEIIPNITESYYIAHSEGMKRYSERRKSGILTEKEKLGLAKLRKYWASPETKQLRSNNAVGKRNSTWRGYADLYDISGNFVCRYETFKYLCKEIYVSEPDRELFTAGYTKILLRSSKKVKSDYEGYTILINKNEEICTILNGEVNKIV